MESCLVLSARRYSFKDDAGKAIDGVTVTYLTGDTEAAEDLRGMQPLSITAPFAIWDQLQPLPGYFGLDFKQRPGPKGKPTLQLVAAKFEQKAELVDAIPQP
jgi:hypothetical protein